MPHQDEFPVILDAMGREMKEVFQDVLASVNLLQTGSLSSAQKVHAQHCRKGIHRAMRVLDDVLLLGSGVSIESQPTSFSPAARVTTVAEALEPLARRAEVTLKLDISPDIPKVEGDAAVFDQIVTRLIEYAIRSAHQCAVQVAVKAGGEGNKRTLWFSVSVPVTKPYVTEDDVSLSLSRVLVSRLGGELGHTVTGTSSSLQIFLPVQPVNDQLVAQAKPEVRVLIAEDSDESFQIYCAFLRDQPCTIGRAVDGEEALEKATSGQFDLVFMDVTMPRMNGYEATRRIREWETSKGRNHIPIVVLSAEPMASQLREGAIAGCSGYLEKPVMRPLLVRTLSHYMDHAVAV